MKEKILSFLAACILFLPRPNAQTIKTDALDSLAQKSLTDFDLPGLAIGIVRNDSILFAKGYGTREINKDLPVNTNTTFGIGSISKSFTALTLGKLSGRGKKTGTIVLNITSPTLNCMLPT